MTTLTAVDFFEMAYADALELIRIGDTREDTFGALIDRHPEIEAADIRDLMAEAHTDATRSGDPDDIDPSWED